MHELTVELSALQIVILNQNSQNLSQSKILFLILCLKMRAKRKCNSPTWQVESIKTIDLEKGNGMVTAYVQNLGNGTYSYSLIIDGKLTETKKMVKMR